MRQTHQRTVNRLLSVILALTLVFPLAAPALAAEQAAETPAFQDLDGNWAREAVLRWAERGVIRGNDGLARPDDPISRAEAATMLNRVFGYRALKEAQFDDVPSDAWFRDDMLRLHTAGIMQGDGEGHMRPDARITRQESAAILFRAFGLEEQAAPEAFTDGEDISAWAKPSVNTMAALDYLHGYPNGDGSVRFGPMGEITRAEFVTILDNMAAGFYHEKQTYPAQTVKGNAILRTPGVRLRDVTVEQALYLAEGLGDGDATLEGLRAGRLIVRAGGVHSIYIEKSLRLNGLTVTEGAVPVALKFPLSWRSQVRDYFKDAKGVEITTDKTYCVVTFTGPFDSDRVLNMDGKSTGGSTGGGGGGGGNEPDVPDVPDPPIQGEESAIGDPVTADLVDSNEWLGQEANKAAMQPAYTRTGNSIAASGYLAKVTGLTEAAAGADATDGYFAAISIPLPAAAESAVRTADGTVLTFSSSGWSITAGKDLRLTQDGPNGAWYLEFLIYLASAHTDIPRSYTMTLDYDGSGNAYCATTYTLDFSGVALLAEDVPFAAQPVALKEADGYGVAHTAAGVTLDDSVYKLDAATLEKTLADAPDSLALLKDGDAYAAMFVFEKPAAITSTPASVEVTVDGQAVSPVPGLTPTGGFEKRFPLRDADGAYLPNGSYSIAVVWKDVAGAPVGISQATLSRQTTFTVAFDYQDANLSNPVDQTVVSGEKAPLPDPINKLDKSRTVIGWCLDDACTQPFDPDSPITANLTLYAKWGLPDALQAMVDQFTGGYDADVDTMTITPRGEIAFNSKNITIPEGMQLTVGKTITKLTVQNGSTLQINGTLRVEDKTISGVSSLTSASMSVGGDGLLSIASKSQQEQKYIGGINYLPQQTLRSGEGPVLLNDTPEPPPQMIASEDAVIRLGGTTVYFDTGTIYVTESFYYIHSDNSVTVNEDAEVRLLHDMILHGKLYLHGKITPTEGFRVIADANGGSSSGTDNARVYVDRTGVDLSAFALADDVRNVQEGVSTGPVALKWDMGNLSQSRWINAVGNLALTPYSGQHDTSQGGYVYMYNCDGLDWDSDFQINLYQNEPDTAPMELPDDGSIGTGAFGWILVTFNQKYNGQTYYLEVEQAGVSSTRVKVTVGEGLTP